MEIPFTKSEAPYALFCLRGREQTYKFEEAFAKYIGVKHAVAFSSGRFGLTALYSALGLENKEIIIPAYTCIPVPNSVMWSKNTPVFADITLEDYNISYNDAAKKVGKKTGAIIPTHLHGLPCDLKPFIELGNKKGIPMIEDAAIALGAEYNGRKVGSIGDAAIFSLQGSKIMTSWRGGVVTTNNTELYEKLQNIKSNLKEYPRLKLMAYLSYFYALQMLSSSLTYKPLAKPLVNFLKKKKYTGYDSRGISKLEIPDNLKYKFSNSQALIARKGLGRLNKNIKKRILNAEFYEKELKDVEDVILPNTPKQRKHVYGRYPIRVKDKREFGKKMLENGVEVSYNYPYICPDCAPYSQSKKGKFPNSEIASKEIVLLPMRANLTRGELKKIAEAVKKSI